MKCALSVFIFLAVTQLAIGQHSILWKVTATINDKTSFIVGTFHQFGNSFVDSVPGIKEALFRSELAVFESIDGVERSRGMIHSREPSFEIEKGLKKKDLEKLKAIAKDWKVDLYKLKPVEIRWKLQQVFVETKCGTVKPTDEFDHFDNYLVHLSKEKGIEIVGLETDSLQLSFIEKENNYPDWKNERNIISYWIDQLTTEKPNMNPCVFAEKYRNFDLDYQFNEACNKDVLIFERNQDWMLIIPDLLRTKNVFIAVGYLHLTKQCGILEQLKNNGFKVEPVKLNCGTKK